MNKAIAAAVLIFSFLAENIQYINEYPFTYTPVLYLESTAYLDNPYIGFYHIYGYILKDEIAYASPKDVPFVPDPETTQTKERLVQIQINLCRFQEQSLTETALSQLDTILSAWSETNYSLLLRFLYDWDGNAPKTEPNDISVILQHMEQLAPVYNKYADHIFMIHGLFTGNHGEMHHTHFDSPEDLKLLASKLAETADPSIYLSVRTPYQWRTITGADNYEELSAMPDSPYLNRLGLFNDGMFGTEADTGTYSRPRAEEIAYQDALCQTVPNGGEAVIDNPYNDLDNAVADMKLMHVSYLNSVHDPSVINKWKNTIYTGQDVFNGVTGFEYVRNHLGYRYVLRSSSIVRDYINGQVKLRVAIENVGFSKSYRPFSFCLTLRNTRTQETFSIPLKEDSTCLVSGETASLEVPLAMENYPAGTYELYWQTLDETFGEPIRYGNNLTLTDLGYLLGSLRIKTSQE